MNLESRRCNSDDARPPAASDTPDAGAPSEAPILDELLRETATTYLFDVISSGDDGQSGLTEALGVARQYLGQPLSADPITVDLVAAILSARFDCSDDSRMTWRHIAVPLAGTLYEDPTFHASISHFWERLQEAVT